MDAKEALFRATKLQARYEHVCSALAQLRHVIVDFPVSETETGDNPHMTRLKRAEVELIKMKTKYFRQIEAIKQQF